jgi:protein-tyrosine phosphatase
LKEETLMIDLHSHLLPGLDDGAANLETALAMLRMASEYETTSIIATPHVIEGRWLPTWTVISAACDWLRQNSSKSGLDISIFPGAEVYMSLDILKLIPGPGPYCINNGRYLLVELPAMDIPCFANEFFFILQTRGIIPILAHPERHPELAKKPVILQEWVNKGIMTQLNGTSLLGRMGERVQATAEFFLLNNLIHFIGSDAHGLISRQPKLLEAGVKIRSLIEETQAQQILVENPKRLIANNEIEVPQIRELVYSKHPGGIRHWFY